MGIYRSTNPLDFGAVDGIVINEQNPPAQVLAVGTGIAIICGQFERGPLTLNEVSSISDLQAQYGKSTLYPGYQALRNKKFSRLRIIRVTDASGSATAAKSFLQASTPILSFAAKQGAGVFGNSISVAISAGTTTGKKYTVTDTSPTAALPQETYDNVTVATIAATSPFAASNLVTPTVLATLAEPDNITATLLTGGLDGTPVDTDYEAAMDKAGAQGAGNVLFLDIYNSVRNAYLKLHIAIYEDKMVILAGPQTQAVSAVVADAASYRDLDGRIIYAYPWVETPLDGVNVWVNPASWYASLLSQIAPNVDPAYSGNATVFAGITDLAYHLARPDYIQLMAAGVSAFEIDTDIGIKIKSGITTQLLNSDKIPVTRRRMTDYLEDSMARFFKVYQNDINNPANRKAIKGAMLNFIGQNETQGILPKDSDVPSGLAKIIDTESLNTDSMLAQGYCTILYKQRLFSSMRFIVLTTIIGPSVIVTTTN